MLNRPKKMGVSSKNVENINIAIYEFSCLIAADGPYSVHFSILEGR